MPETLLIQHRVNTVGELKDLPQSYGAEVDIRTWEDRLILNHEPYVSGEDFETYLRSYSSGRKGPLILNTKEDGLEDKLISLCSKLGIENYFFLDTTLPTTVRLTKHGFKKVAIRASEYEPAALAESFAGLAEWVWLDCFTGRVPSQELVQRFQALGFRVCLVSPELQKYPEEVVKAHASTRSDAVCTKFPKLWSRA